MNNILVAKERKEFRKSILTQLRKQGYIPAVVYGKHEEGKPIFVKNADLLKNIREIGRNGIISLDIDGKKQNVILEDFQSNPINHEIIHADFLHINMSTEIHAKVHVALMGTSKGVEDGGVLQQSLHQLNITAKPKEIPETIEIDISELQISHTIKVGAIRKNYSNITINHDDDEVIVTVIASKQEEENSTSETQSGNIVDNDEEKEA